MMVIIMISRIVIPPREPPPIIATVVVLRIAIAMELMVLGRGVTVTPANNKGDSSCLVDYSSLLKLKGWGERP
jgi:hypothetical protein